MTNDDLLFGYRLQLFALAAEIGVRPACRQMGIHHSTYYRWKRLAERHGLEILIRRATVFTLRAGKIAKLQMFSTREQALEAAGLSE